VSRGVGMEQARGVEDLIGGIYDAAVDPELWPEAIAGVVEATGCRTGVFYEHDVAAHQSRPLGFYRFDTQFIGDYEAHYGALDPWNSRVMQWPVGLAAPTYALLPEDELRRTEFYQDYLRRTGIFRGLGGLVERKNGRIAVFGVQRGYEEGHFTPESIELVRKLMPHLKRAYRIHAALGDARRDREALEETLRVVPQPVLIVDRDARVVFANAAAEHLLGAGDGIRLAPDLTVAAAHRDDQAAFQALLHPAPEMAGGSAMLRRPRNRRPLLVRAVPLRVGSRWAKAGRVALLLDAGMPPPLPKAHLTAMFGLTPAEVRLWSCLVAGGSLAQIAVQNQVSVNTLRVQLGRLFDKVGVRRQADLVRRGLELGGTGGDGSGDDGPGEG
jgi:DNA-binding CsgD family transcriptional regulator